MLRIAVPNKGALSQPAADLLQEAGYRPRSNSKELVLVDEPNGVELFFLRPRDIAVYVGGGTVDVGITGLDMLIDSGTAYTGLLDLGFAGSTFRFAGPAGSGWAIEDLQGKRVATSYELLVGRYLGEHGIDASIVHLDGAVESSIRLGVADVIADVVETGSTLRAAGLETFGEPIMHSEAVLFQREGAVFEEATSQQIDRLLGRLRGVLVARKHLLLDYDIEEKNLPAAVKITPGFESPTISPLHDDGWVAVRTLVLADDVNTLMDEIHAVGARAILVTQLQACRI